MIRVETRPSAMQTATLPAMAHDQENVAPVSKAPQPAPEPEKKKKYVGARERGRRDDPRASPLGQISADRRVPPVFRLVRAADRHDRLPDRLPDRHPGWPL